MKVIKSFLSDCLEIESNHSIDSRGEFIKIYNKSIFNELGIQFVPQETFYTRSKRNVLRGLHFQAPPSSQDKLTFCIVGEVYDVVVDLRKGSPFFGHFANVRLTGEDIRMLYIPRGFAHGFYSLSEFSILGYHVSEGYNKNLDLGIRWNSLNITWPCNNPIISERDSQLPIFSEFKSPFVYEGK